MTTKESPTSFVREQAERLLALLDKAKNEEIRVEMLTLSLSLAYQQGFSAGVKANI